MAIHFCTVYSEANLVGPEAQHKSIKILLNSGSYLQNVSPEHSSSSCAILHLLRISGNSSNLTWISLCFRSFGMNVRAGLATARRLIQHIPPDLLLTTVAYLWPVKTTVVQTADDDVFQIQAECGIIVQELGWSQFPTATTNKLRPSMASAVADRLLVFETKNINKCPRPDDQHYAAPHTEYIHTIRTMYYCKRTVLPSLDIHISPHTT